MFGSDLQVCKNIKRMTILMATARKDNGQDEYTIRKALIDAMKKSLRKQEDMSDFEMEAYMQVVQDTLDELFSGHTDLTIDFHP